MTNFRWFILDETSIHPNRDDHKSFEENHIIQKCLNIKMCAYQVLALYEALAGLEKILIDKKKKRLNLAAKFLVENNGRDHEEAMKFFDFNPNRVMNYRCLYWEGNKNYLSNSVEKIWISLILVRPT